MASENNGLEKKCFWKGTIEKDIKQGQKYSAKGKRCVKCPGYDSKCYIYNSIYRSLAQVANNLLN